VALPYPLDMVRDVERRWRRQWRQPVAAARFIRIRPDAFIVAIGGSGDGGLQDVQELLEHFPSELAVIVLVVLHRPVDEVSYLREVLERRSAIPIRIARNGEWLKVGHCYIGEPGQHLVLGAGSFAKLLKEGKPQPIVGRFSQETLAEMIGTTRSRVSFFMNKFRKLGFIEYNGNLEVHNSLLNVILYDNPEIKARDGSN
jgi:hypothetical protein